MQQGISLHRRDNSKCRELNSLPDTLTPKQQTRKREILNTDVHPPHTPVHPHLHISNTTSSHSHYYCYCYYSSAKNPATCFVADYGGAVEADAEVF